MSAAPTAHPYAEAWPMLGEEEIAELAADIATNGLREPIVRYQGKILDGRNRHAACQHAGAAPRFTEFDGDDDDALAFVQSVNNGRRHQSKGSLAASWALSMLAAGKRSDGRWAYGASKSSDLKILDSHRSYLGVIADHTPDLLTEVRDDEISLNAAHQKAEQARDAERQRLDREEREAAEEAEAKAFITDRAPDLAKRVDGDDLKSYVEALDLWNRRNTEEAERIRKEKEAEAKAKRDHDAAMTDLYTGMSDALSVCGTYGGYDDITELMAEFKPAYLKSTYETRFFDVENLRAVERFAQMLITWRESRA